MATWAASESSLWHTFACVGWGGADARRGVHAKPRLNAGHRHASGTAACCTWPWRATRASARPTARAAAPHPVPARIATTVTASMGEEGGPSKAKLAGLSPKDQVRRAAAAAAAARADTLR